VEPQCNGTRYGEQLSIVNTRKVIVARAVVMKKENHSSYILYFLWLSK